ncbi:hypothetical protein Rhopal_002537-T1 [Rhodotorula paludigena]|uniref:HMG box domain-containing protein n=1 Tax=Rhodotorula paludigena TaxID=86838 RepID=A0AAV5GJ91_9BASI|nr:hypothetical protein Rhopal_002537-T1 [Rhodotorula paludigena]
MPRDKSKPASSSSPRSTRSGAPTTWLEFLAMERKRLAAENPNIKHKTLMRKAGAAWKKRKAELEAQQEER